MSNINILFQNNSDNWKTPKKLYDYFVVKNKFVDMFEYCSTSDQYEKEYEDSYLFCNPPYSHLNTEKFINYIWNLLEEYNNHIVLLIPSRTDTRYFQLFLEMCDRIHFFRGRLHFNDSKRSSTFPSCLMFLNFKDTACHVTYGSLDKFVEEDYYICG